MYVRKFEVMMGRTSKQPTDVALGDNMNISRQHAKIVYNFQSKAFELIVMGKNGAWNDAWLHGSDAWVHGLAAWEHGRNGAWSAWALMVHGIVIFVLFILKISSHPWCATPST